MTGEVYKKQRWLRVSKRVRARSPICEGCDRYPSQHADHIKPVKEGGALYDMSNLQALCPACHNAKTAAQRSGKQWIPPKLRGCDVDGHPRDPKEKRVGFNPFF